MRFKVGDKVRILTSKYKKLPVGAITTVTDVYNNGLVKCSSGLKPLRFMEKQLELIDSNVYISSLRKNKVSIKKLTENAVIPKKMTSGAVGMDIVATSKTITPEYIEFGTGLAIQVPEGYGAFLLPRSSLTKTCYVLNNSIGLIDTDFFGEMRFRFKMLAGYESLPGYEVGDRIGQLVILPVLDFEFQEIDDLGETDRSSEGFGSTNK